MSQTLIKNNKSITVNYYKRIKRNIIFSYIFKVVNIGLNYILVSLTINYFNSESYGIWVTLLSFMSWITFFDIGLGKGLRNKLTEALNSNDLERARIYVSTAYFTIASISLIVILILIISLPFINWTQVFNTNSISQGQFVKSISVIAICVMMNFILSLGNDLFYSTQNVSLTGLVSLLNGALSILFIIIITRFTRNNLLYLAASYGLSMLISTSSVSIYFFKKNTYLIPSVRYIKIEKIKDLVGLGFKFFIIQICMIVMYTTDNMVITQVLGPTFVSNYNIVYKLFNFLVIIHSILLSTLWSAYTVAYINRDFKWIKKTLLKLNLLLIPVCLVIIFMIVKGNYIVTLWLQKELNISRNLFVFMGLYVFVMLWSNIYAYFLNGISRINLQMICLLIGAIINIPMSIFFIRRMGVSGTILGTIVSLIPFAVIAPIEVFYIIRNKL